MTPEEVKVEEVVAEEVANAPEVESTEEVVEAVEEEATEEVAE